eukprot:scaffold8005_cov275-Amphora_coffeaeformis.AAC.36
MFSVLSKASRGCGFLTASSRRGLAVVATVPKDRVPSQDGDRLVLTDDGMTGKPLKDPILLANVSHQYYAIHSICPHMQKSMEKGKIFTDDGPDPILRCRIHNTRFNMRTGRCVKWVTGALGYDNALIGRVAQNVGGEKQDIPAYAVHVNEDGSLTIDDEIKE